MKKRKSDIKNVKTKVAKTKVISKRNENDISAESQLILEKRAQKLAVKKEDSFKSHKQVEIIEFSLGNESYGIETFFVREVYHLKDFTSLPGLPAFILGIINVRGQILSIIDLKKFFHIPEKGLSDLSKVIIIHHDRMEFGVLAEAIHGIQKVETDKIHHNLPNSSEQGKKYIKGITDKHVIILDAQKILNDDEIIVNQITE